MLVLTRKVNERITIGDDIVIVVTMVRDGVVKLGIDAPQDLVIRRQTRDGRFEGNQADWRRGEATP